MAEKLTIVFTDLQETLGVNDRILFTQDHSDSFAISDAPDSQIVFNSEFTDSLIITRDSELSVVFEAASNDVVVFPEEATSTIVVSNAPGPQGPAGPPGSAAGTSQYVLTAESSRVFTHNLPYPPGVRLIDSQNRRVFADVEYLSETQIYVSFPTPFTGRAILF